MFFVLYLLQLLSECESALSVGSACEIFIMLNVSNWICKSNNKKTGRGSRQKFIIIYNKRVIFSSHTNRSQVLPQTKQHKPLGCSFDWVSAKRSWVVSTNKADYKKFFENLNKISSKSQQSRQDSASNSVIQHHSADQQKSQTQWKQQIRRKIN